MTYAFVQDVPIDRETYLTLRDRLGDVPPPGLISHVVLEREGGLRYVDVWDSEAAWTSFRDEKVLLALFELLESRGVPVDPSGVHYDVVQVVDAWLGRQPARV
jgi:hypothetical protein